MFNSKYWTYSQSDIQATNFMLVGEDKTKPLTVIANKKCEIVMQQPKFIKEVTDADVMHPDTSGSLFPLT